MNFAYLISSHVNYQEPLRRLLKSMDYVPGNRKIVVIGGSQRDLYWPSVGALPTLFEVTQNSFDYTAIIAYLNAFTFVGPNPPHSHVFLLHDTMEISPETDALIAQADPEMDATAAHENGQCNLALFRVDYLLKNRERIMAMRNCSKSRAVEFEGVLWRDAARRAVYHNYGCTVEAESPVYAGGLVRRTELYPSVMIRKFKASWGQSMETMSERVTP